jgi:hypothetical protein
MAKMYGKNCKIFIKQSELVIGDVTMVGWNDITEHVHNIYYRSVEMPVTKLVMRKARFVEDETITYKAGYEWLSFVDPETGKEYLPKETFKVTGKDLEELFDEYSGEETENAVWVGEVDEE